MVFHFVSSSHTSGGTVCVHRTENSLPISEVGRGGGVGQGLGLAAKTSLDPFQPLRTASYFFFFVKSFNCFRVPAR